MRNAAYPNSQKQALHDAKRPTPNVHPTRASQVEILTTLGMYIGVKSRKISSELELYSTMFKFVHLANAAMFGLLDVTAALAYIMLLMMIMVIAPAMADSGRSNVEELRWVSTTALSSLVCSMCGIALRPTVVRIAETCFTLELVCWRPKY